MTMQSTRRGILKGGLAVAGLSAFGIPEWALPALAQGETLVPFTDFPANIDRRPAADRRLLDIRNDRRAVHAEGLSSSRRSITATRTSTRRRFG